jgi:hypothetical protein
MVDLSRNDGVMEVMWRKRGEMEKVCEILTQTDVTNISPHRMYEIYLFFLKTEIILTDTFALCCLLWAQKMC